MDQFSTMCAAFQATAARCSDLVALRTKGDATRITWREYATRVRALASGLAGLGVGPGDTVGILMTNRPEFNLIDTAAMHLGAAPFSMYLTSSADQLRYLLTDSGARVIATERAHLPRLRALGLSRITFIVVDGDGDGAALSLAQLAQSARPDFDFDTAWRAVTPDTVLTLIYTSGTTGDPKGVELTHANMVAQIRGFLALRPLDGDQPVRVVSYLPHAHIADRFGTHYLWMWIGGTVTACPDPRLLFDHVPDAHPTDFTGVPRVWEKLKAGIEARIAGETPERRATATAVIEASLAKVRLEASGQPVPPELAAGVARAEQQLFAPLRAALGLGDARRFFVGAAPSTREVLEFFYALGMPICEVWGMSELSACGTVMPPGSMRIGTVGVAMPGVELRLADDGELLVRGPIVMRGYRNRAKLTRETIDREGWLHTGDVADIAADGYVRIIDRKKEIIISSAGKNMSPANIEARLKASSPLIGQAVAFGDGRPYNVALLVLDPDGTSAFCRARGIDPVIVSHTHHPAVREELNRAVAAANDHLSRPEQIKRYTLLTVEWLPGGDELTPTMKLKRRAVATKYAREIDALYAGEAAE